MLHKVMLHDTDNVCGYTRSIGLIGTHRNKQRLRDTFNIFGIIQAVLQFRTLDPHIYNNFLAVLRSATLPTVRAVAL